MLTITNSDHAAQMHMLLWRKSTCFNFKAIFNHGTYRAKGMALTQHELGFSSLAKVFTDHL